MHEGCQTYDNSTQCQNARSRLARHRWRSLVRHLSARMPSSGLNICNTLMRADYCSRWSHSVIAAKSSFRMVTRICGRAIADLPSCCCPIGATTVRPRRWRHCPPPHWLAMKGRGPRLSVHAEAREILGDLRGELHRGGHVGTPALVVAASRLRHAAAVQSPRAVRIELKRGGVIADRGR